MITRYPKTAGPGDRGREHAGEQHAGHDENCRCKETAAMTPGELLKRMISDLAVWKKNKNK